MRVLACVINEIVPPWPNLGRVSGMWCLCGVCLWCVSVVCLWCVCGLWCDYSWIERLRLAHYSPHRLFVPRIPSVGVGVVVGTDVGVGVREGDSVSERDRMCVCVCERERERKEEYVCVCTRETESARERVCVRSRVHVAYQTYP